MSKIAKRTKDELYAEALAAEKAAPFDQTAFLLLGRKLISVLAAWPFVIRTLQDAKQPTESWDFVVYDKVEWADLSGITLKELDELEGNVRRLGLIYSDGTFPKKVREFLDLQIQEVTGNSS